MERIKGVELWGVWDEASLEKKIAVVRELAGYVAQMRRYGFEKIGSLYFEGLDRGVGCGEGEQMEVTRERDSETKSSDRVSEDMFPVGSISETLECACADLRIVAETKTVTTAFVGECARGKTNFVVGPMISPELFYRRRLFLPSHRGPFGSSLEWMTAEINLQIQWIESGYTARIAGPDDPDYENSDWDSDFDREAPDIQALAKEILDIIPRIFPAESDKPPYILDHRDLHSGNILVNPETFAITGIIDWENVCVIPYWKASEYPKIILLNECAPDESTKELNEQTPFGLFDEDELEEIMDARNRFENDILQSISIW